MTLKPWESVETKRLTKYKVFDVVEARRRSPRTGQEIGMFVIDTLDWVNVVAFTPDDQIVLVRQWRQGSQDFSLEIPGGARDPGSEGAEHCALRELREETGYVAANVERLGGVNPNNALFSNRCDTFLATGCVRAGDLQMDPGEDLEVVLLSLDELESRVRRGEVDHALVLAGLYFYRLRGSH